MRRILLLVFVMTFVLVRPASADSISDLKYNWFLTCTRYVESDRGTYPYDDGYAERSSSYGGAYQFTVGTWNSVAKRHYPELVGVHPSVASPEDQDKMAWALYQERGASAWNGRCKPGDKWWRKSVGDVIVYLSWYSQQNLG